MDKILKLNCRTCAQIFSTADLLPLFTEIESKKFPVDCIKNFYTINFKILPNDGLSQSICYNCIECFVKFAKFIEQCEISQMILQKQQLSKNNKYNCNDFEETVNICKYLDHQIQGDKITFLETKLDDYLDFENADNSLSEFDEITNDNIDEDFIDKEYKIVESTKTEDQLKEHQESSEHMGIKQYDCDFCDKSYKTYDVLRQHKYRKHKNEKLKKDKYYCTKCTKSFYDENRLNLHIKKFHKNYISDKKRKFECDECKKSFANIGVLERHLAKFHQNINKLKRKHICTECGRSYPRSDHLQLHMRREHLNEKPFQCGNCGKKYAAGYQLTYHMKSVHTPKQNEKFECDICHKIYSEKYAMNRHKKKYHTQNENACFICKKIFNNYGKLDRHYHYVHNDELLNGHLLKNTIAISNSKLNIQNNNENNNFDIEIYETENDIAEIDTAFLDLINEEI